MTAPAIVSSRSGDVTHLRIARAASGNRLTLETIALLEQSIRSADCSLLTLTSEGTDFCLGREPSGARPETAPEIRARLARPITSLYDAIASAPFPILGAVQGRASGFGCALATSCDITIAADDARFGLPELVGGIPPTLAMSTMLRRVAPKTLGWLVYGGKEISAADARLLGMVSEVVAPAELAGALAAVVDRLVKIPRDVLYAVKEFLRNAPAMSGAAGVDYATALLAASISPEAR
jgi:enoyl-CoA hydratase